MSLMILTLKQWLPAAADFVFLPHIFNDKMFVGNTQIYFSQSTAMVMGAYAVPVPRASDN